MPDPTKPATTPDTPDMEAMLRQAAQASDNGEAVDLTALATAAAPKGPSEDDKTNNAPGLQPEDTSTVPQPGAKSTDDPSKANQPKPGDPTKEKEGSDYAKAKAERERKDQERFDRNWRKLEEEREQLRREREEWQKERERTTRTPESRRTTERTSDDYTPEQWESAAKTWEREGKFDLADAAREKARQLREQPQPSPGRRTDPERDARPSAQPPEETPGTEQFRAKWTEHLTALANQHAELKDPKTPLYQTVVQVLRSQPRLHTFNDGIVAAVEIAQLQLQAKRASELEAQLKEQAEELTKLRKATQPGAGGSESAAPAKRFEDMTAAEQEAHILALAREQE